MTSKQLNRLSMFLSVQGVFESHESKVNTLPALKAAKEELDQQIASIQTLAQVQSQKSGGAADKAQTLQELIDTAFEVAAAVRAYAVAEQDSELAAKLDYSRTDVSHGRDHEVIARCQIIHAIATEHVASLADCGITPAKLTALNKKIEAFRLAQTKPRQGRTTSSAATRALPELFRLADEVLSKRLDGLMVQFRASDVAFFNEYEAARTVLDMRGGRAVKESESKEPALQKAA